MVKDVLRRCDSDMVRQRESEIMRYRDAGADDHSKIVISRQRNTEVECTGRRRDGETQTPKILKDSESQTEIDRQSRRGERQGEKDTHLWSNKGQRNRKPEV